MHIALSGPSGIGKGYVQEHILRAYPLMSELRWLTTRPRRTTAPDRNRESVNAETFAQLAASGELVLVRTIFGHNYGLRRRDLVPHDGLSLTEVHPDNLAEAHEINPELVVIGLLTSDETLLRMRLAEVRRTESPEQISMRLAESAREMQVMRNQREHYTALIDVTRASEAHVVADVLAILRTSLP